MSPSYSLGPNTWLSFAIASLGLAGLPVGFVSTEPASYALEQQTAQPNPSGQAQRPTIQVNPPMGVPGQVIKLTLSGDGLKDKLDPPASNYHFYWMVDSTPDCAVMLPVVDVASTPLSITVSILPQAMAGKYELFRDGSTSTGEHSCNKKPLEVYFQVGTSLGEYTVCPLNPYNSKNADLLCSYSLVTYKEERDVFGKAVADQYVAVEIRLQNRDYQFPFLLADVRMGRDRTLLTTSRDRTFVRAYAEKNEAYSARALIERIFHATTAILGGVGPVVGDALLSNAIQITQGPADTALRGLLPDRSQIEMNFISDNGFSVVQTTVVPPRTPIKVFCFMPQRSLLDEKLSNFSDDSSCWSTKTSSKSWKPWGRRKCTDPSESPSKPPSNSHSNSPSKFQQVEDSLFVEIAGMHVTQANTTPTLTGLLPDSADSSQKDLLVSLVGSNFSQIGYLKIGEQPFLVVPQPGNANAATITIHDVSALQKANPSTGPLPVSLINTLGQSIDTSLHFTIRSAPPATPAHP